MRLSMFSSFPREVSRTRSVVNSLEEYLAYLNKYNGKRDIYVSLYQYRELDKYGRPKENSALIDKVYFDLDMEGDINQPNPLCYEDMLKMHLYYYKLDIIHVPVYSGGGYHFIFR